MAILELSPLGDHLEEPELTLLQSKLDELEAGPLEIDDEGESIVLSRDIEDGALAEVLDLLDANSAASDLYLPTEFEDTFEIEGLRVGSAATLLNALEELKEDIDVDEGSEDELDEEQFDNDNFEPDEPVFSDDSGFDQAELKNAQLQHIWKLLYGGAQQCLDKKIGLFLHS